MKKNVLLLIALVYFLSPSVYALDLSGSLTYSGNYNLFFNDLSNNLRLELNCLHNFTDKVFLEADLVLRYTDQSSSHSFILIPKEIYISTYDLIPQIDAKAGILIESWGSSDMFSPLDNFNPAPFGLSFTEMPSKLGVWAISATYYINDTTYFQSVYLPNFVPTLIGEEYEEQLYLGIFAPQFQEQGIEINSIDLIHYVPEKPAWGVKIGKSFSFFDAALSYYRGYYLNSYPQLVEPVIDSSGTSLKVELGHPERDILGLEFQGDFPGIEGATLRGDIAYIIPQPWSLQNEYLLKDPYFKIAIGADYTTSSNLYLNIGYIYGFTYEEGADCSSYLFLNAKQELRNSKFTPHYIGGVSLQDGSMLHSLGLDYNLTDNFSLSLSYLFIIGEEGSKFGQIKNNEGLFIVGEWSF